MTTISTHTTPSGSCLAGVEAASAAETASTRTTARRRFFVRHPDGSYAVIRGDEYGLDELYEYDAKKNQFVRVR